MPEKQRNVFIAISAEGKARSVKSGAFVKKYHLPSLSSVNSAMKGLLEKDFETKKIPFTQYIYITCVNIMYIYQIISTL